MPLSVGKKVEDNTWAQSFDESVNHIVNNCESFPERNTAISIGIDETELHLRRERQSSIGQ